MKTYLVSEIKKIKIKEVKEPMYLVKWYKSTKETWEPIHNFPDNIDTYPGYDTSIHNLWRVRNKDEKEAIDSIIKFKKQKFEKYNIHEIKTKYNGS